MRERAAGTRVMAAALASARGQQALTVLLGLSVLALGLAAALTVSFLVSPDDIETGKVVLSPPCASRLLFGVDCPICGLSRAFCALSHGELSRAMRYHSLAPVLYLLTWLGAGSSLWGAARSAMVLRALPSGSAP
jgi:hypothetical protein